MSYDRLIDQVCPHAVSEELLFVEPDRKVVKPSRPIASFDSLKVRIDGVATVPSSGIFSPASVVSTAQEPFVVTPTQSTLVVQVGLEEPQVAVLPPSSGMSISEFTDRLNRQLVGLTFEARGHRVAAVTVAKGEGAIFKFVYGSTLASTLGFSLNRVWRGKTIYPGWTLVNASLTLLDRPQRWIVFDRPLRTVSSFIEIDYTTQRQECRRCGGLGVENDWLYGVDGSVFEAWDEFLLIQELTKILYTLQGTNPFNTWYGTDLLDLIGRKLVLNGVLQTAIHTNVLQAFRRWQSIKKQQEGTVGQEVSDAEYPYRLLGIKVNASDDDPTVIYVEIEVQNRSFNKIQITRGLRIPQPYDLLGSTTAQGVLRQSLTDYAFTG